MNYYLGDITVIHFKGESTVKDKNYFNRFYGAMSLFYEKYFQQSKFEKGLTELATKSLSRIKFMTSVDQSKQLEVRNWEPLYVVESNTVCERLFEQKAMIDDLSSYQFRKLIFDLNSVSIVQIISCMNRFKERFQYRFLLNGTTSFIGSDNCTAKSKVENIQ